MSNTSLSLFKCPSCGAPLEPEKGASAMKCPYCGASVIIPETLRSAASDSMSLSDVTELAKQGRFEEAAKIYGKITGLSQEYALISVKSMAGVRDDEPTPRPQPSRVEGSHVSPPPMQAGYSLPQPFPARRGVSCGSVIGALVALMITLGIALPLLGASFQFKLPFELPENIVPVPFAKEVMSFGVGPFKDPRAIGVDAIGNILVLDYNNDEVLIFGPEGDRLSSFVVSDNGNRIFASEMAVTKDGLIYIPLSDKVIVLNENGEILREVISDSSIIHSIAVGGENVLHAMTSGGIVRFDANGDVDLTISNETLEEISGDHPGSGLLAADRQGNIYFSGTFNKAILIFSPEGEFIRLFGGSAKSDFAPGEFDSPRQIAFDGLGRIYVVDFFDIQVFDSDFNYINVIDGQFWGVDFDAQNNMYGVTNLSDDVEKYEIQNPTP